MLLLQKLTLRSTLSKCPVESGATTARIPTGDWEVHKNVHSCRCERRTFPTHSFTLVLVSVLMDLRMATHIHIVTWRKGCLRTKSVALSPYRRERRIVSLSFSVRQLVVKLEFTKVTLLLRKPSVFEWFGL